MKGQRINFERAAELAQVESQLIQILHPRSLIFSINEETSKRVAGVLKNLGTAERECLGINSPPDLVRHASYAYPEVENDLTSFEKARVTQDYLEIEEKRKYIEEAQQSGELREIMEDCDRAITVGPAALGLYYKGTFHEILDEMEMAAAALSRAYELGEKRAAYGAIYDNYLVGNRAQAKKSLARAHQESHLPPDTAKFLGIHLLFPDGNVEKPLEFLQDGASLGMDVVLEPLLSMHLMNGEIIEQAQGKGINWKKELQHVARLIIRKNPKSWRGYAALALICLQNGNNSEARANIEKALELTLHRNAAISNIAAQIYANLFYYHRSEEAYREKSLEHAMLAAKLDPGLKNLPAMVSILME